jgi:hypothetical protein
MRLAMIAGNLAELTLRTALILGLYGPVGTSNCTEDEPRASWMQSKRAM